MQYSPANQLIAAGNASNTVWYAYGPDRNRTGKSEINNGQTWKLAYIDPGFEVLQYAMPNGSWVAEYRYPLQVNGRVIATRSIINNNGNLTRWYDVGLLDRLTGALSNRSDGTYRLKSCGIDR